MSSVQREQFGETPTVRVHVYEDGELIHTERCESEGEAAAVAEWWEEIPGIVCEIDDLSGLRHDVTSHEVESGDPGDAYPYGAVTAEDGAD